MKSLHTLSIGLCSALLLVSCKPSGPSLPSQPQENTSSAANPAPVVVSPTGAFLKNMRTTVTNSSTPSKTAVLDSVFDADGKLIAYRQHGTDGTKVTETIDVNDGHLYMNTDGQSFAVPGSIISSLSHSTMGILPTLETWMSVSPTMKKDAARGQVACGSLQCDVYILPSDTAKTNDPPTPLDGQDKTLLFDTQSHILRGTEQKDNSGSTTTTSYEYDITMDPIVAPQTATK